MKPFGTDRTDWDRFSIEAQIVLLLPPPEKTCPSLSCASQHAPAFRSLFFNRTTQTQ